MVEREENALWVSLHCHLKNLGWSIDHIHYITLPEINRFTAFENVKDTAEKYTSWF